MANKEDIFREMSNNASESDIRRIDENIDGMKRGKLAEVWDKVMQLYRFVPVAGRKPLNLSFSDFLYVEK